MLRLKFSHSVILLLLLATLSYAAGNESITTPLPDSNTQTFRTDSRAMWKNETAAVLGRYFPTDWVFSGGLHGLSGTCTSSAFGVEAFTSPTTTDGRSERVRALANGTGGTSVINYSTVGANCSNPGSDVVRVAACSIVGNSTGNWQRYTGSNYFVNAVDTTPDVPPGCAGLMDVVITNGAITLVGNIAKHSPVLGPPNIVAGLGKNVRECGALVDGITDDTVAINNCLATYPYVFVPAGTLLHSGTILVNIGNRLSGVHQGLQDPTHVDPAYGGTTGALHGGGTTLLYTGTGDAISFINTSLTPIGSQITIEDLAIRSSTLSRTAIHIKNAVGGAINRVFITGQAEFATGATGFGFAGIWLDMTSNGTDATFAWRITNSEIRYLGAAIPNGGDPGGYGIVTYGNNNNIIHIIGNSIQGVARDGLAILGHGLAVNVSGNEIEGNGRYETFIDYGAAVHYVANYSEHGIGNTNELVYVQRCTGCTFENNPLLGLGIATTPAAIHIGKTAGGFTTQGIRIIGNHCGNVIVCFAIDYAQGLTIEDNVLAFSVGKELGGDFSLVESFNYKRATCDPTGAAATCTNDEAFPVTFGQDVSGVSVVNSSAKTEIYSYSIQGNTVKNVLYKGGFEVVLQGLFTNVSGAPQDLTITSELGTTTLSILKWAAVAAGGGNYAFLLRAHILPSAGFPGNQDCYFQGILGAGDTVKNTVITTSSVDRFHACYGGVTGADLALDQTFKISVTLGTADADLSFTKTNAYLRRIGY